VNVEEGTLASTPQAACIRIVSPVHGQAGTLPVTSITNPGRRVRLTDFTVPAIVMPVSHRKGPPGAGNFASEIHVTVPLSFIITYG
jgi:hypothetical protein